MSGQSTDFIVEGIDCPSCAADLEKSIAGIDGVTFCDINFTVGKMRVQGGVVPEAIVAHVKAQGYTAIPAGAARPQPPRRGGVTGFIQFLWTRADTRFAIAGGALIAAALATALLGAPAALADALFVSALVVAGYPIARSGLRTLVANRDININLLMTIAAVGALLIGEHAEAATVIFLFAIGEALEGYATDRARDSLRSLVSLVPDRATVLRPCVDCAEHIGREGYTGGPCPWCGAHEQAVDVASLQIGETILVKPGERIPMDGRVTAGASAVNQAPITGESMPVHKAPGAEVFAGTVNGGGALEIEVTQPAKDNTLQQVIRLVEEAQSQRAPVQRFIDRFARVYTPAVVMLAALVAVTPPLLFGAPFYDTPGAHMHGWLYRALALLVIACPCALVISTPVAVISGITGAARRGVLIKGGAHLEALGRIKAFAFDKTGTLTEGRPQVTGYRSIDCLGVEACAPCNDMLALATAVERRSEHPLAQAVVKEAERRALAHAYSPAESVEALAGRGVRGQVNGRTVTVGSHTLFHETYGRQPGLCQQVEAAETDGQTAMLVGDGAQVRGYISVADTVRASSREAVAALKAMGGVEATVMLTGDNPAVARAVGEQVGVDEVRAALLPGDKVAAVRALAGKYGNVAMVGDGVNDAPALAAATVGIAMGGAGSAQALETADVALMADDLAQLPYAVGLARAANRVIKQNVIFSLGIKTLFLLLALAGAATLWMAVFADVGTSLLVTLNGMRPLRYHRAKK
ncbi:MAG: heavy metal translocating P-type ATPase [Anaerolineae bacterium]|nr:heavy metal translocating P-type ATPase [Anaerolineae bacterium]